MICDTLLPMAAASEIMRENTINALPVVKDGRLMSIRVAARTTRPIQGLTSRRV
jgi:CBS domain-containing protein